MSLWTTPYSALGYQSPIVTGPITIERFKEWATLDKLECITQTSTLGTEMTTATVRTVLKGRLKVAREYLPDFQKYDGLELIAKFTSNPGRMAREVRFV